MLLMRRSLLNMWRHPMNMKYQVMCAFVYIAFAMICFFRIGKDDDEEAF
jgi:hypothetical protein